jgi:type I restriction enzyme S subunit
MNHASMKSWKSVRLGDLLSKTGETIEADPSREYREITVKLWGKGVIERGRVNGAQVNGRRFVARAGNFIASRIDARNGAMGLVPESLDGALVTNDFPLFQANKELLDLDYLGWLSKTAGFVELCLRASEGTTNRVRLKEERFLNLEIPLPPLAEQRRIVARIEALAAEIAEARALRHQAAQEAEALVSRSRVVRFAKLATDISTRPLGELVSMASGNGLTSSQMDDSAPYPVYGGGGFNGRYTRYLFEEPKIVIGRVGARCGCVFVTEAKSWVTDNALYLKEISDDLYSPFLVHALTTLDLRQQANQAAQPVVSQKKINPMRIPVPPLPEQRRIVAELDALQAQVDVLKRLQSETAAELDALLPAILDRAFKGEL